jgi:RimJ/RimL family protein N-acetyltransferase
MLSYRDIDPESESDVACLVRWANDPSIRHLFQVFASEEESRERLGLDLTLMRDLLTKSLARGKHVQLVEWDGRVVGEISCEMDFEGLYEPRPGTAWLGIVIGEEDARGQGMGRKAMLHLENFAKTLGAKRAQIGVFEFNTRARRLYESLGYQPLTSTPDYTWWKGKHWKDLRMGKPL